MRVTLLGFGLIGGSIARALAARQPGSWTVTAWSPSGRGPGRAAADGTVASAAATIDEAVDGAELVVLAAPPLPCLDLLDRLATMPLAEGAIVTDVASTKRRIVARASELRLPFVGGHPMAGRERTGYESADPDLFVDRPWIVTRPSAEVEALARAVGARPVPMAPAEHDEAVSVISHLPLVVAAALVEAMAGGRTAAWPAARPLAAGGWRDTTRLARGDEEMGAGILATNAAAVAARLRTFREVIDEWIATLEPHEPDVDAVRRRLAAARQALGHDR